MTETIFEAIDQMKTEMKNQEQEVIRSAEKALKRAKKAREHVSAGEEIAWYNTADGMVRALQMIFGTAITVDYDTLEIKQLDE